MKYGMNMLLWTTEVTDEHYGVLDDLKGYGYDGVELPIFEMDEQKFGSVGTKLDEIGLERTAVTICTPDANPISPEADVRTAGLDRIKRAVDCARAAGVTKLCGPIHSALGEFTGVGPTETEWRHGTDTLREAAKYAATANVTLVLECLNRFECYFLNCAADTARFVREVDHPNLRMMYDTFHANIEEKSIVEALTACKDVLAHVHISECDRSTPGEGKVDFAETFDQLRAVKYAGDWFVVEAFGLALPDLAAATKIWRRMYTTEADLARNALRFMKSSWKGN